MTEEKAGLVAALAEVQKKLPNIGKGKTARVKSERTGQEYTYKYADLADIAEEIHPLLSAQGLAFIATPKFIGGQYRLIGTLEHVSGDQRSGEFPLPDPAKPLNDRDRVTPQVIGSAITYGRRYLLCSLTGVVADEDDDGAAASKPPVAEKRTPAKKAQPQKRAAPDPREPLWADLKIEREKRGWSADDLRADFANWSTQDKKLDEASGDELRSYLLTLVGDGT